MCLLALLYRLAEDAPVVVGANREEEYRRGGSPPQLLDAPRAVVAGLDPVAGGTWLGVNAHGLLVAVTNRRRSHSPAQPRSRGLLVRDLLGCPSAHMAVERASAELERGRYAGCNLLCADAAAAVVLHAGDRLRVRPLAPGVHVLGNHDVDDPADVRIAYAAEQLSEGQTLRQPRHAAECVAALRRVCASTEPAAAPVCFRAERRGTVSSSILALPAELAAGIFLHAQGPPDRTPYGDRSDLLRELASAHFESA
jgi:uncharacterized protein with NRDE domain